MTAENVWVLLVVGLLGGLVGVLEQSKAAMGFTGLLAKLATTRKKVPAGGVGPQRGALCG